MDERELDPEEAAARHTVDELSPCGLELLERRAEIVGLERHVVHARAPLGEETADRRVLTGRREELDATRPDEHRRRLDALIGDRRAVLEPGLEEMLVRRDRLVEVAHRHAEVMDAAHRSDAIGGEV